MAALDLAEWCGSWAASALAWALPVVAALLVLVVGALQWRHSRAGRACEQMRARLLERDRAIRLMHDRFLQGMQGLVLRFQALAERLPEQDATRSALHAALVRADALLDEARDAVDRMRQAPAASHDLAASLGELGHQLAGSRGFLVQMDGTARHLSADVHLEVSHIMSEALRNAFRHAQAQHVVLALHYGRWRFSAEVVDDGIGMGAAGPHGDASRRGMAGMRERAECIAAHLTWQSRRGGGTRVLLLLPARRAYQHP